MSSSDRLILLCPYDGEAVVYAGIQDDGEDLYDEYKCPVCGEHFTADECDTLEETKP